MDRRLLTLIFAATAILAIGLPGAVALSAASYTTASDSLITASTDGASGWLHLYSQGADPDGLTGYATQRVRFGTGAVCATGSDDTLDLVMGGIRGNGTTYTFNRAFTIQAPAAFPDAAITSVTVTATYVADPGGRQPIRDCRFNAVGSTGGSATITLTAGQKRQANIRLRANGGGWVRNRTYHPTLRLTVTYTGGPAAYYVYDVPLAATIVNW